MACFVCAYSIVYTGYFGVSWKRNLACGQRKGLRYALTLPEKFQLGVAIQTDSLQGSLWHGFSAQGVTVKTESADIAATSLKLKWQPTELIKLHHLHINELIAGDVHIQDKPTPPKPKSEPLTLPENLSLPFTAAIDKLQVGKITQGKKIPCGCIMSTRVMYMTTKNIF